MFLKHWNGSRRHFIVLVLGGQVIVISSKRGEIGTSYLTRTSGWAGASTAQ